MRVRVTGVLMLGMLVASVLVAQASTAPPGTEIVIPEAQSLGATIWNFLTGTLIPLVGVGMGVAGMAVMAKRQTITNYGPWGGIGGGVGAQFVPGLVGGASRVAPAATGHAIAQVHGLPAWVQGFLGQTMVLDPVVVFAVVGMTLALLMRASRQRLSLG